MPTTATLENVGNDSGGSGETHVVLSEDRQAEEGAQEGETLQLSARGAAHGLGAPKGHGGHLDSGGLELSL